jgi:hypothetical protein
VGRAALARGFAAVRRSSGIDENGRTTTAGRGGFYAELYDQFGEQAVAV